MIQFDGHAATVCSLAFSPDSMTLASGAKDGGVKLWDAGGGVISEDPSNHFGQMAAVTWSPTGEWLVAFDGQRFTRRRLSASGCAVVDLVGKYRSVTRFTFVSDHLLAAGTGVNSDPGSVSLGLWDSQSNSRRPVPPEIAGGQGVRAIAAHLPTKRLHWIGLPNRTACVWRSWCITSANATDVKLNKPAADIAVSPDGGTVAIASDWMVRVFTADGKPKVDLSGHKGQVPGVGFIHGGRTVVSASWDETVRFWDVATGKETARFPLTIGKLTALAVSPDGTRVAVGGTHGPIVVIDAE